MFSRIIALIRIHAAQRVLASLLLVGLAAQMGAPLLAATRCGLIIPHEHVLLGGANRADLAAHEAAEAGCGIQHVAPDVAPGGDRVLSIVSHEGHSLPVLSLGGLVAFAPTLPVIDDRSGWAARIEKDRDTFPHFEEPPVEPPPEIA